jgi:hypothetical protein
MSSIRSPTDTHFLPPSYYFSFYSYRYRLPSQLTRYDTVAGQPTDTSPNAKADAAARKKISMEDGGQWKSGGALQNSVMCVERRSQVSHAPHCACLHGLFYTLYLLSFSLTHHSHGCGNHHTIIRPTRSHRRRPDHAHIATLTIHHFTQVGYHGV